MVPNSSQGPMERQMPKYAPDDFAFFSASTPSVFAEYLLPIEDALDTRRQAAQRRRLERIADDHGTYVYRSSYRLG